MFRFVDAVYSEKVISLAIVAILGLSVSKVQAATKDSQAEKVEAVVKEALHREIYGLHADRARLLDEAAKRDPQYGPAHWHRGLMRVGTEWRSVDKLIGGELAGAEKEYELRRSKLEDTAESHLRLANWCRERSLPEQERSHLTRVLDLNPDQPGIRERLGLRNINGEWLTKEEIAARADRSAKEAEAFSRWRGELREIAQGLRSAAPDQRNAARKRLIKIHDSSAIPAMETILSTLTEECALAVVDAVAGIEGQESTDSLIRHAVFSQWQLVREAAAEKLRSRPRESFVPDMISEMYLPLTSRFEWAALPNGRFGYRHLVQREGAEEREVVVIDTEYSRVPRMGGNGRETLQRAFLDSLLGVTQRETSISRMNSAQLAVNQRLTEALNVATNQQQTADPQKWWKWWDEENDVARQGEKQTRYRQQVRQVSLADRRPQFSMGGQSPRSGAQTTGRQARAECFVAGTSVLSRRGPVAIEKIQIGDMVLAQNPETGELAFKPVLGTTVRPAEKLVKLTVGRDVFETSKGHLYWAAGQGWCKASHLDSGMQLHCLKGSQSVSSIEEGTEAATFNLVVADFHTYFVGEERVLSHDVTNRRPTNSIVPGLKAND